MKDEEKQMHPNGKKNILDPLSKEERLFWELKREIEYNTKFFDQKELDIIKRLYKEFEENKELNKKDSEYLKDLIIAGRKRVSYKQEQEQEKENKENLKEGIVQDLYKINFLAGIMGSLWLSFSGIKRNPKKEKEEEEEKEIINLFKHWVTKAETPSIKSKTPSIKSETPLITEEGKEQSETSNKKLDQIAKILESIDKNVESLVSREQTEINAVASKPIGFSRYTEEQNKEHNISNVKFGDTTALPNITNIEHNNHPQRIIQQKGHIGFSKHTNNLTHTNTTLEHKQRTSTVPIRNLIPTVTASQSVPNISQPITESEIPIGAAQQQASGGGFISNILTSLGLSAVGKTAWSGGKKILGKVFGRGTKVVPEVSEASKVAEATEAVPEVSKVTEATEAAEAVPEATKVTEVVPEVSEASKVVPEVSKVAEAVPEVSKVAEAVPEVSKVAEVVPEIGKAAEVGGITSKLGGVSKILGNIGRVVEPIAAYAGPVGALIGTAQGISQGGNAETLSKTIPGKKLTMGDSVAGSIAGAASILNPLESIPDFATQLGHKYISNKIPETHLVENSEKFLTPGISKVANSAEPLWKKMWGTDSFYNKYIADKPQNYDIDPQLSQTIIPSDIKNNNPANIRQTPDVKESQQFFGTMGYDKGGFNIFQDKDMGTRALFRDLQTKANKGNNTVEGMVEKFAPASDNNNLEIYKKNILNKTGLKPTDVVDTPEKIMSLGKAIAKQETGTDLDKLYTPKELESIYKSAENNDIDDVNNTLPTKKETTPNTLSPMSSFVAPKLKIEEQPQAVNNLAPELTNTKTLNYNNSPTFGSNNLPEQNEAMKDMAANITVNNISNTSGPSVSGGSGGGSPSRGLLNVRNDNSAYMRANQSDYIQS